jgi:hypothetical protein
MRKGDETLLLTKFVPRPPFPPASPKRRQLAGVLSHFLECGDESPHSKKCQQTLSACLEKLNTSGADRA